MSDIVERAESAKHSMFESVQLVPELVAEVEQLRAGGPWVEHVERQRAMKLQRDGECICDNGPDTSGPDEFCPWHGREYRYLVDELVRQSAEVERLRGACKTLGQIIENQCQMVLNITGLHNLVDETGDGDWGLIWEKLAELGSGRLFDE
ncbi:hypothetical protein [Mycolicibacterium conceptionense]|uniref:Uncharacterized protein n=1 Tax=Mycolicibacterium conceptionense TaxID=451644 RepID=A0A1A1X5Q5_9MYCO|nr:hypothetical protein [Mycolicibacterium conceptionense]OBF14430.1 hypothetical protein A5726_25050 [Mycolicibacterium conceptionense]OBF31678.1 hypothetical protein A5720_27995 [Mycolicibacterium conceptionense]OBH97048.1 hypothetical protein A5716_16930 [Mycolicibacterium conceptionense]